MPQHHHLKSKQNQAPRFGFNLAPCQRASSVAIKHRLGGHIEKEELAIAAPASWSSMRPNKTHILQHKSPPQIRRNHRQSRSTARTTTRLPQCNNQVENAMHTCRFRMPYTSHAPET
ncbi:hypothetical protein DEO72_LG10g2072 [Vigna unguiculata]|uniref:Uncharacterized protein n=1 Tax=Vigna unguiculata TaxID=3917 RepID=A0A4D6NAD2_VIGUN|nr:hypothetical protein DEO72_LG10g2072 [Vigna unguiculata]